jgi:hypothetical protein
LINALFLGVQWYCKPLYVHDGFAARKPQWKAALATERQDARAVLTGACKRQGASLKLQMLSSTIHLSRLDEVRCMARHIEKTAAALVAVCMLLSMHARAGQPMDASKPKNTSTCVDVTVNGHPVLGYDCLNQRLAPETAEGTPTRNLDSSSIARLPSNQQVGQFNLSSFSHRMGANLGKSAVPQRPPALSGSTAPLLSAPVGGH